MLSDTANWTISGESRKIQPVLAADCMEEGTGHGCVFNGTSYRGFLVCFFCFFFLLILVFGLLVKDEMFDVIKSVVSLHYG